MTAYRYAVVLIISKTLGFVSNVTQPGQNFIHSDDDDTEKLYMASEACRFCTATILSIPCTKLPASDVPAELSEMLHFSLNKLFCITRTRISPYDTENAYGTGKSSFKRPMRIFSLEEIPNRANVISSHTLYKFKI